jgi:hypothetical protein
MRPPQQAAITLNRTSGTGESRLAKLMSSSALETNLTGVEPAAAPLVLALDDVLRKANPNFDVEIRYRILLYALHGDWRTWVCAIDARKKSVSLRFL